MLPDFEVTPEQQMAIDRVRDKWIAVATDTRPTDRPRAEAAIREMYHLLKRRPPRQIVWCGSPLAAVMHEVLDTYQRGESDEERIAYALNDLIFSWRWPKVNTRDAFRDIDRLLIQRVGLTYHRAMTPLEQLIRMSRSSPIYEEIWQQIYQRMRPAMDHDRWRSLRDHYQRYVLARRQTGQIASFRGQYDADLMAYYDYFLQVPEYGQSAAPVQPLMAIAESASWIIAGGETCWVAERHTALHMDDDGRLHHEHGPALAYPDGLEIYAWHGVTVPAYVITHPEWLTLMSIERMLNIEVRRVMIERYGEDRFLIDTSQLVQTDAVGELYRRLPDWQEGRETHLMVRVRNSTPEADGTRKSYILRVPPDMQTAQQAVAWTFGLDPHDYRPQIET